MTRIGCVITIITTLLTACASTPQPIPGVFATAADVPNTYDAVAPLWLMSDRPMSPRRASELLLEQAIRKGGNGVILDADPSDPIVKPWRGEMFETPARTRMYSGLAIKVH